MKKFLIPSYPVAGRFDDQESAATSFRETVKKLVEAEDDTYFGWVSCGMGGGYAVDFAEDWELHPVETVVFLTKPTDEQHKTLADVAAEWPMTAEQVDATWQSARGVKFDEDDGCKNVPCEYVFETMEAAKQFVAEMDGDE